MQALNQEQHGLRPVDACLAGAWPGTQSKIKMSCKHSGEMRGRERIICIACQLIDKNLKGDMCLSVFPVWKRRAKVDVCCKGWCECSWNWSCGLNKRRQLVRIMVPICKVTPLYLREQKTFLAVSTAGNSWRATLFIQIWLRVIIVTGIWSLFIKSYFLKLLLNERCCDLTGSIF